MKFLSSIIILTFIMLLSSNSAFAQNIAITMDNPNSDPTPLLNPETRDKKILSILEKNHLKIVLFVQGAQVDNPQGRALLARWSHVGQIIGNHTYSHLSMNEMTEEQYEEDSLKNERLLQ